MIIYKSTNNINGQSYIGKTTRTLQHRINGHKLESYTKKSQTHFHNALRKYGIENFTWEIIFETDDVNVLNDKEIFYIDLYNTFNNGYNLTFGGDGSNGFYHTEYSKIKISISKKKNNLILFGLRKEYDSVRIKMKYDLIESKKIIKDIKKTIKDINKTMNNTLVRSCPKCGKEIEYISVKNRNRANKRNSLCMDCGKQLSLEISKSQIFKDKLKETMKNLSDESYNRMIEGARKGGSKKKNII